MTVTAPSSLHGIKDNHSRGKVADYLAAKLANSLQQKEVAKRCEEWIAMINPHSQPSAPNIPKQAVVDAADAVEKFLRLARRK
jgi:hypothetical protein